LADHLIFKTAKTYTYTRPLFRAYSRESTIQPSAEDSGNGQIDPTKGRVAPGDDPHWATDGLTNKFIGSYWSAGTCPLKAPEKKPLNIVILATSSFNEEWIHTGNVNKLARGLDGARVVLYAINAIDNKVAEWHNTWTQNAERNGIPVMVRSAKRNLDRGFESKLVSQLPLMGHIRKRVAFDYMFTIDGDISLANADMNGIIQSIRKQRPLVAQPTIRVPPNLVGGNMFTWGSQWYKAINDEHSASCGDAEEYDSPIVESQAAILSKTFLDWYHQELEQVAQVQHEYQCDWGHDEMWCSAAARLSEKLPHKPPACVIIRHSVDHHDTKSIAKYQMHSDGGTFLSDCQKLEAAMQDDKDQAAKQGDSTQTRGQRTGISVAALRDHTNLTCVNVWADMHGGGCKPPTKDTGAYSAVKSFRAFMQGPECRDLQDEKAAAEASFALTRVSVPPNAQETFKAPEPSDVNKPFVYDNVVPHTAVPVNSNHEGDHSGVQQPHNPSTRFESASAGEDMLAKERIKYGPHFAPRGGFGSYGSPALQQAGFAGLGAPLRGPLRDQSR